MIRITFSLVIFLAIISCNTKATQETSNDDKPLENDWIVLFDGTSTDGWRGYNSDILPPGWVIEDGTLTFDTEYKSEVEYTGGRDIIYGVEEFENFELYVEWKLPKGANSGIFYHVKEGYDVPYLVAPEYQVLDDAGWEEMNDAKLENWQKAGADYAMYPPDSTQKILNPAGEWNSTTIKFTPELVEHWLNGVKVVSFAPWSDDWYERKNNSKWKDTPDYGKFKSGYIGLQDHDSPLWFRNIKIKKL